MPRGGCSMENVKDVTEALKAIGERLDTIEQLLGASKDAHGNPMSR